MRSRFVLVCLVICLVVGSLGVVPVFGSPVTIFSSSGSGNTNNGYVSVVHPSYGSGLSAMGTSFNATTSGYITSVSVDLTSVSYDNSVPVVFQVWLYACSGSAGVSGVPTGSVVEKSSNVSLDDGNRGWNDFAFTGVNQLVAASNYSVVVVAVDGSFAGSGGTKRFNFHQGSVSLANGNGVYYNAGGYLASGYPLEMIVYGSSGALASPYPSATSGGSGGIDLSNVDWLGAMNWIAILLLMLVPTFILGVYMRGGKWGFLLGLGIGTGLSYFVFPSLVPIWLVILLAIGLGAAFLTSVREGG